jgi:hypothetical protein
LVGVALFKNILIFVSRVSWKELDLQMGYSKDLSHGRSRRY